MTRTLPALVAALATASAALAQTGPALLLKPWQEGQTFELNFDSFFEGEGNSEVRPGGPAGGGADVNLQRFDADLRLKLGDVGAVKGAAIGVTLDYLNIDSLDPVLPERLVDQQIAFGATLCQCEGWEVAAVLGVGYAGNNPFADAEALYAMADVYATRKLDEQSSLQVGINYHGNRSIFPDVPLPTISYTRKVSDAFRYTIGIPYSVLQWKPADKLTIDVSYVPIYTIDATVSYQLIDTLMIFGAFKNRFNSYTIDQDLENRRVFFEQRRLEAGVEWKASKNFSVTVAGGFAFDQEFSRGWDVRDNDTVAELSDEPYVRAAVRIGF